ncbi:MAG TPA: hypothetical protein VGL51_01605 [Solirubrobacteraceae bacterium]
MPRIIVQTVSSEGEPRRWTLAERIVSANSDSEYYMAQLIDRLAWATADAEALESQAAEAVESQAAEALEAQADHTAALAIGERRTPSRPRERGDRPQAQARRTRTA